MNGSGKKLIIEFRLELRRIIKLNLYLYNCLPAGQRASAKRSEIVAMCSPTTLCRRRSTGTTTLKLYGASSVLVTDSPSTSLQHSQTGTSTCTQWPAESGYTVLETPSTPSLEPASGSRSEFNLQFVKLNRNRFILVTQFTILLQVILCWF